jgi:hypothetical protein
MLYLPAAAGRIADFVMIGAIRAIAAGSRQPPAVNVEINGLQTYILVRPCLSPRRSRCTTRCEYERLAGGQIAVHSPATLGDGDEKPGAIASKGNQQLFEGADEEVRKDGVPVEHRRAGEAPAEGALVVQRSFI